MPLFRILAIAAASVAFTGAALAASPPEKTEIRYQGWAGQVTWLELAEDLGYLAPLKAKWVGNTISGPQDIQSVVTGDVDVGGAFNGAVVKLLAKKAPIKAVLGYYGADKNTYSGYYVKDDSPIRSARDLVGKKIAVNTLGAHHEFMVREYLERNKLSEAEAKQVTLVVTPPVTGEQALRQGQVDVTTLGGVLRDKALERGGIRPLFTDRGLYGDFTAGSLVLHTKFIEQNPNATRQLVGALARSIEWARRAPPSEVRARFVKIIETRKRAESAETIQYWQSTGVAGAGGVIKDAELQVWIDWLVKDGLLKAAQVKPGDLYTNAFNPYFVQAEKQAVAK
jgi:ABC-type nitrate/sulfonate/bicarbonate transport system substrate-binding protein